MKKVKFVFITLFLIICFGINIYAVQHNDKVYIYDKASILEEETKIELTKRLAKLYDETFADIRIFTIETLHNQSIEDISKELLNDYEIGVDDLRGSLILLSKNERQIRVEVGAGLKNCLNNKKVESILVDIKPYLEKQDYNQAFLTALPLMENEIRIEYTKLLEEEISKVNDEHRDKNQIFNASNYVSANPKDESFEINIFFVFPLLLLLFLSIGLAIAPKFLKKINKRNNRPK